MPTSVALGHHFEDFLREQVHSGRFSNASEVVRAGLRLLEEAEQRKQLEPQTLHAEIAAGLASGPGTPSAEVFDRLQAKYEAAAKAR